MSALGKQILLLSVIFLLGFSSPGAAKIPDSNIIARFDNEHTITIKELNQYIQDLLYHKKYITREDIYNNALEDMLTNQLKRIDFFEKGYDKDNRLIQNISRIINDELVLEYYENQYAGKYATEENAKKAYTIMDKEVVYQLIELSKPKDASQKSLDSLEKKALSIKSEIENGKDFKSLVKIYSKNPVSVNNDGYMPPIGWKQSIADPLGRIIFNLKKNEIRVVNSDEAISIVKVVDINKIPVAPYDSIKNNIISDLKSLYAYASQDDYENDKKNLIDENSLVWNEAALDQIVQWSTVPGFYKGGYRAIINKALNSGDNNTILSYNKNSKIDYKELLRLLSDVLVLGDTLNVNSDKIKDYLLETVRTDLIIKKADSLDLRKGIFNAFTNNLVIKNQLVRIYNQVEVEGKIPEATDKSLYQFFKENENTLYYHLEKRNFFVMVFQSKEDAEKAAEKISGGTAFEKVTGSYLVKTYIKERNGKIISFTPGEEPIFDEAGFKLKESEVSGVIEIKDENLQQKYALIKCYYIRPERQLTYDDVKDSIVEDYKAYHRKQIHQDLREKLISKYNPVINEDILSNVISAK